MTYSIVARDPETGELGVAVQSRFLACGAGVCHAEAGVGAVATQSIALYAYGARALHRLQDGEKPAAALAELVAADERSAVRQVAIVDADGLVATHTGTSCIDEAGHRIGAGYSVQANMMARSTVWDAMAETFEAARGPLVQRLLAALDAAEAEGGDVRGRQAAGIRVVGAERTDEPGVERPLDLRVDDHPQPLVELRRLVDLQRAYELSSDASDLADRGDRRGAVELLHQALALADNAQIRWTFALVLAGSGELDAAREQLDAMGPERDGFVETTRRLRPEQLGIPAEVTARLVKAAG